MKVLLVNPSRTYFQGTKGIRLGLPLGLMYVAATLERAGHEVGILDCLLSPETRISERDGVTHHGLDDEVIRRHLREAEPDVVGIGAPFTAQAPNAVHVLGLVREVLPEAIVVCGGPHFTVLGQEFMADHPEVDFVIAGEGEVAVVALLEAIKAEGGFENVPNLMWRDSAGALRVNGVVPIEAMDELPLPAYHLVDMALYFRWLDEGLAARVRRPRAISMITSRGCPYTCTFCSINLHMGYKWRAHSVEYTLRHIRHVVETYGVAHISFEDDNFTFKRSRCQSIVGGMVDDGIRITWDTPNGVRADTLNDELLSTMKRSGCLGLIVAAESGDQEVVDNIVKKKIKLTHIVEAARLCHAHKIPLGCFFIIGFPGETRQQIQTTLDFAFMLYSRYDVAPQVMVATPLYGTELHDIVYQQNLLVAEMSPERFAVATQVSGGGMIKTDQFDPDYLKKAHAGLTARMRQHRLKRMLRDPRQYPALASAVVRRVRDAVGAR